MATVVASVLGVLMVVVALDISRRATGGSPSGVEEFDVEQGHTQEPVEYSQSPPVGGEHNPAWQNSGFYEEPVRNEAVVHTLEHGAVWIAYSPDLPQDQKNELRETVEGQECLLASPYPDLPEGSPVVASAWSTQLRLDDAYDPDLQRFIQAYRRGPQAPESGAACTGGVGGPA